MVREYETADFESVKKIYTDCFPFPYTVDMLKVRINRDTLVYEASSSRGLVGYLLLTTERKLPYLSQVAVCWDFRGMGIATQLIRTAENRLKQRGHKEWWLQTEVTNPAQKLYLDLGFQVSGFEKNIYAPGKHGIVMTRKLQ